MNEPKAIQWTYSTRDELHYAFLSNSLLKLVVYQTRHPGKWCATVIGWLPLEQPELFDTADEAKLWAEHCAHVYAEQMLRELRASETGENVAESEASDG